VDVPKFVEARVKEIAKRLGVSAPAAGKPAKTTIRPPTERAPSASKGGPPQISAAAAYEQEKMERRNALGKGFGRAVK